MVSKRPYPRLGYESRFIRWGGFRQAGFSRIAHVVLGDHSDTDRSLAGQPLLETRPDEGKGN